MWTMSQRTGSVSYQTFAAGFSLAVYALFVHALRSGQPAGRPLPDLRPERPGRLHRPSHGRRRGQAVRADDSPLWYVTAAFLLYFGICYLFIRYMEKNGIFLKL